ncbi:MAG: HAMP domain-containing sensor histidine kinase [Bacteroidales bacterium]|nr:HAMP domain-containing sensor histidine kinase [Bacteroidales bacterium]
MIQRHYHLYVLVLSLLLLASGGFLVWAWLTQARLSVLVLGFLLSLFLLYRLWQASSFLPSQVKIFLSSMLNRDMSSRFPQTGDKELQQMYRDMNYIMQTYSQSVTDLETKNIYYDRILRIMTHELRNSLTPIISVSEDMLTNAYSPEETQEAVEVIHGQCVSIKQFLDSYQELTHLPKPVLASVNVSGMLSHVQQLYPDFPLTIQCAEAMTIQCDESLIRQILVNLVKNAREASATEVVITASAPNGIPRITVADNGMGIPEDKREEIFLPFYTSKETGSGIGLALSRQIMNLHGGTLTCSAHEKTGTLFILEF